jgi:hypothetical protein
VNEEAMVNSNAATAEDHMEDDMNAGFDWVNHFPSLSDSEESVRSHQQDTPNPLPTPQVDASNFTERLLLHVKTKGLNLQQVHTYDQKELDTIMVLDALVNAGVPNTASCCHTYHQGVPIHRRAHC